MSHYQIVGFGGTLTADVKVFKDKVAKFSLAVNSGYGDNKNTTFWNCVAFSTDFHEKVWGLLIGLKKGSNIGVEGKFKSGSYEKDGEKVKTLDLNISNFTLYYTPKAEGAETPQTEGKSAVKASVSAPSRTEEESDDIPF